MAHDHRPKFVDDDAPTAVRTPADQSELTDLKRAAAIGGVRDDHLDDVDDEARRAALRDEFDEPTLDNVPLHTLDDDPHDLDEPTLPLGKAR